MKKDDSNPWMYVSIFLGVLLAISMLTNFGYSAFGGKATAAIGTGGAIVPPSGQPVVLPPPTPSGPVQVDLSGAYSQGPDNAPVTIVEYSDFECPFCARAFPTIKALQDKYGNNIRFVYKHFPLGFHPQAQISAEASECAGDQGKFFEYHDAIFADQPKLQGGAAALKTMAKDLGLKQSEFDSCLDSGKYTQKVKDDFAEGQKDGVSGTPTFYINGQQLVGAQPIEAFEQIIDAELNG